MSHAFRPALAIVAAISLLWISSHRASAQNPAASSAGGAPIELLPDPRTRLAQAPVARVRNNRVTVNRPGNSNQSVVPPFRPPVTTQPNRPVRGGDWRLKVHAYKSDTGMLITSVIRGGAADRAGLEAGDRIITVGGEQVGFVGSRTVSMRNVLQRHASRQGDVLLLVQPRRGRGLINVSVRLDGGNRR